MATFFTAIFFLVGWRFLARIWFTEDQLNGDVPLTLGQTFILLGVPIFICVASYILAEDLWDWWFPILTWILVIVGIVYVIGTILSGFK